MTSKYPFFTPCPVEGCKNNKEKYQWIHAYCGKKMYINSDAELECENGHCADMIDWFFRCENHDFQKCSKQSLLLCLTIIAKTEKLDDNAIKSICLKLALQ